MTATEALGSQQRAPSEAQLRGFGLLSALYLVIAAAVVPWAAVPGPAEPEIIVVYGTAILVAELCTAALLGVLYLGSGRPALLVLACAYLYSSLMAGARVAAYPGALVPRGLFGGERTAAWLFDAWWVGTAALVLAAVVVAAKAVPARRERVGAWLLGGCALTVAAVAVLAFVPAATTPEMRWTAFAIYAAALALIWRKRAFGDSLYVWLGLALVATMAGLALSQVSGMYTVVWYASRVSFLVGGCLLLAYLLGDFGYDDRRMARASRVAAYGGAVRSRSPRFSCAGSSIPGSATECPTSRSTAPWRSPCGSAAWARRCSRCCSATPS